MALEIKSKAARVSALLEEVGALCELTPDDVGNLWMYATKAIGQSPCVQSGTQLLPNRPDLDDETREIFDSIFTDAIELIRVRCTALGWWNEDKIGALNQEAASLAYRLRTEPWNG